MITGTFSFSQTITIGSGTSTNQTYPIYSCYEFNYTQQIYTAAQIGQAGTINKIRFYYDNGGPLLSNWNDWKVLVGHTTKTDFASETDWIPLANLTQVFNGIITPVAGNWFDITFTTPFVYNGTSNFVVAIDENAADYSCSANFRSFTSGSNTGISFFEDYNNPDPASPPVASGRSSDIAQMQVVFASSIAPGCAVAQVPATAATNVVRNPTLTWTEGTGGPTSYDVYFGTAATPPFVVNQQALSYAPVAPLNPNTTYYWKVVPKNSNGDATGCIVRSFTTGADLTYCAPVTAFGCSNGAKIGGFSTNSAITNINNLNSGCASLTSTAYSDYTSTMQMSASVGTTFNVAVNVTSYSGGVKVWIDFNQNGTFEATELVTQSSTTVTSGTTYTGAVNIPASTLFGSTRMRVRVVEGSTAFAPCDASNYGETEDYAINIITPPSCLPPSALVLSALTTSSATMSWTASATNPTNGYDVYYSTSNVAPTAATVPTVNNHTASPYLASGLTAETTYYWWVRSDCGTEESLWALGGSFYTNYCIPTGGTNYYLTNVTTTDGLVNISNATVSNGGYANFSATNSCSSYIGQPVSISLATNSSTHFFYCWIDWNNDLDFNDVGETIFATTSYSASYSGLITIPVGTVPGNYRMRVANSSSGAITSCGPASNGEYEDYTFTVFQQSPCAGIPDASTVTSSYAGVCVSGSVIMTATHPGSTDSGLSYQWYNAAGLISGATAKTYTTPVLTAPETYYYQTTCANGGLTVNSNSVTIEINDPQLLTTTASNRCGPGTVDLLATGSTGATLKWYTAATGGTNIGSGATFTTPFITATTTYYVEAAKGVNFQSSGKIAPTLNSSYVFSNYGVVFNATSETTLASTVIYPFGTGTVTIALQNSAGLELMSTTAIPVTGSGLTTPVTVPLNFAVPVGTGYRLIVKAYTGITGLIRESSGNSFPYTSSKISVTGGWLGSSASTTTYYFFYNIKAAVDCSSPRTAVTATVSTAPALAISNNSATICEADTSAATNLTVGAADFDSYVWSPSTGVIGNAVSGWSFYPTVTTTYTLTASQTTGNLCSNNASTVITVNPLPSALTITPASTTVCADVVQALAASGGTVGSSGSTTIGTATTVTAEGGIEPTAFCNRFEHYWAQMVFTQAELNAAGIQAGNINGIKFGITTIGSAPNVTDYKVYMGSTAANVLTGFTSTGLTQVFSAATYTQTLGVNSIVFNTPYVWNGTSNIIVDIRNTGADQSYNSSTYFTATPDNKTVTARTSTTYTSSDAFAATNPTGTLSLQRLNTTFDWTSTVPTNITWSPITNLYADAAATVPYVANTNAATVYVKSATTMSETYTATANVPSTGCSLTSTALVNVNTTPPTASAQTFCIGATVADLVATGSDMKWFTTLTGGTEVLATEELQTGTYYVSQTINFCESERTSVVVTVNSTPAPMAAAQTFCIGATVADLTATGTAIKWYTAMTGGTEILATEELASGTYFASQTLLTCESERASVTVTVNTTPAPMAAAQTFCIGSTVADLTATGTAIKWYSAMNGGTEILATEALASGTYYASQTLLTCESERTSVAVIVHTTAAPIASDQAFCTGATFEDLVVTGTNVKWYLTATGGTEILATDELPLGVITYYASQTLNNCESVRTSIVVTVKATANAPIAADQNFCSGSTVADLVVVGTIIKWYDDATAGTPLVSTTPLVSGTYYVSETLITCESSRTPVAVIVYPTTPAPMASAQTFCLGTTIADLVATGTTIKWYTAMTGGTALASTTALASGTYYASQTLNTCESVRTSAVITINTVAIPTGATTQTFCGSSNLSQLVATGTNIKWYSVPTGGTEYPTALLASIGLANGSSYYASQTINGCESQTRLQVTVVINATPSAPNASAQAFCNSAMVSALLPNGTMFTWYNSATGGTALAPTAALTTGTYYVTQTINGCEGVRGAVAVTINTTTAPTAVAQTFCGSGLVSNLTATGTGIKWYAAATGGTPLANTAALATGTYYASQTLNACESARTSVAVTVNTTALPTVSANQSFCIGATVANLTATGTAIKWYTAATGGTALVSTTALATGVYFVSQTVSTCESARVSVVVIVNTTSAPTASAQTFCIGATVANLVANGTAIKWYTTATGGTALVSTTALATGTYYASQTLNSCEGVRTSVVVTVNTTSAPTASAQSFCSGATVANLVASGTAIKWYTTATGGSALAANTALATGTYYVSQTLNACESVRTSVTVTVNNTAAPVASITQSYCVGQTVADLVATGTAIKWYTAATGGTALVSTTALTSGVYYASQTLNACESVRSVVVVTVNPLVNNTTTITECDSYTWAENGTTYTASGTYTSVTGCTTETLVLTITPNTSNTTTVAACDTYTWAENGEVYTVSGTYSVVTGCNTEVLELTINTSPVATITRSGDDLNVNATAGATYQWVKCDSLFTPITGATNASYLAIETGSYAVEVTVNGCTVTSDCFDVATLGVKSIDVANLNFYPNPVLDALTVTYTKAITGIQLYDMTGRLIKNINTNANEVTVDMSEMPTAIYIVKVIAENTTSEFRVFKD
ncbi:MAG: GEVED domain-containing protein [Crocinitomicaceae bacterium]|nr:GEVED domain-containing protein [Crocinitomicaceae bacterium]